MLLWIANLGGGASEGEGEPPPPAGPTLGPISGRAQIPAPIVWS